MFWDGPPGPHFGVPISNYLGWFFVAAIGIAIFQLLDAWLNRGARKPFAAVPGFPSRALLGPLLYAGIVTFGITMLFLIDAPNIGWASVFIFLPFIVLTLHILTRAGSYGDDAAVARHIGDFPYNRDFLIPVQTLTTLRRATRHAAAALSRARNTIGGNF